MKTCKSRIKMPRFLLFIFLLALGGSLHAQAKRYPVLPLWAEWHRQFYGTVSFRKRPGQLLVGHAATRRSPQKDILTVLLPILIPRVDFAACSSTRSAMASPTKVLQKPSALLNLWTPQHYPNGIIRNRRHGKHRAYLGNHGFQGGMDISKQKNDATKKMGWLFSTPETNI